MALDAVTKERLLKLIGFLHDLGEAEGHFEMRRWVSHEDESHQHLAPGEIITREKLLTCGTAACALGWATTMPYFQELGLRAVVNAAGHVDLYYGQRDVGADDTVGLFDLTSKQSCQLFGSDQPDKSPREWAKRARGLVEQWGAENVPA